MGQIFDEEISKAEKIAKYNKTRSAKLLDDMATAYLSTEFNGLDKSLIAVKTAKKALRAQGYSQTDIEDYMLQRSYLSKTNLRHLCNESIYTGDDNILKPVIEMRVASHTDFNTTDLIIDRLKSQPLLLSALQRGDSRQKMDYNFKLENTTLLINFYNKNKEIIND